MGLATPSHVPTIIVPQSTYGLGIESLAFFFLPKGHSFLIAVPVLASSHHLWAGVS